MDIIADIDGRRTSADVVFDKLFDEIVSLRLLPGTKISEADIASMFGVSRQPVRDAFSRLGNLGFLLIRPQRATEVQRFSSAAIMNARFVRAAVEIEVVTRAVDKWDDSFAEKFEENLAAQDRAVQQTDVDAFHQLDYDFHRHLCNSADVAFAFETILENKAQIDRLCVLSMMDNNAMTHLVADHREIYRCLRARDLNGANQAMRIHLSRLDATIERVRRSHPEHFI